MFTPEGHVIDMPPGSTPVDFAYRVHTEVGHKCRGAKINGRVVPLNTALKSGDQIQVITADVADPRREWLHEHLGYITTGRARAKIQGWFGNRTKLKNIEEGKRILFDELRHLGIERMTEQELLGYVQFDKGSDLFAAVGSGDINSIEIINKVTSLAELDERDHQLNLGLNEQDYFSETPLVSGIGDFAHEISECCKPVLGDSILGVIDDANIVHVHRQDCIQALRADSYGRLLRLDWQDDAETTFPVTVAVDAYDRSGLLHDITGVFLDEKTNVIEMTSRSDKKNNRVNINMIMEVTSLNELLRTLEKIEQLPNVISARRSILA